MPTPAPVSLPTSERSASGRNASSRRCCGTSVAVAAVAGRASAVQASALAARGLSTSPANQGWASMHAANKTRLSPSVKVKAESKCSGVTSSFCTSASWNSMLTSTPSSSITLSTIENRPKSAGERKRE
jgi:hypothetical protein